MERMRAAEDAGQASEQMLARRQALREHLPLPIEWWFEMYHLVRDLSIRRYPFHLVTYDRLLRAPEQEIRGVLEWLGGGDADAAISVVKPELRSQQDPIVGPDDLLDDEMITTFDEFYAHIDGERALPATFLRKMNALHKRMRPEWIQAWSKRTALNRIRRSVTTT